MRCPPKLIPAHDHSVWSGAMAENPGSVLIRSNLFPDSIHRNMVGLVLLVNDLVDEETQIRD